MKRWIAAAVVLLAACGGGTGGQSIESSTTSSNLAGTLLKLELVAEIDGPVDAVERPGEEVVYLVARRGFVHRLRDSRLDEDPAFDVSDLTVAEGERGLLGLAFSPDGATAYLNYTDLDGHTVIATVLVDDAGAFNRETLQTLLKIEQPYANHNGGDIVVEPSGMLLVATGDGGSGGDPRRLALDVSSLHGKVLRIDPRTGEVTVLARGLRNPWRIDLHDDRLWLADVGQSQWEEVNVLEGVSTIVRPRDFGWSAYEGTEPFNEDQSSPEHLPPVLVYEHGDDGCSISGGAVAESGLLAGRYVFADYCSGRVWSIPTNVTGPSKELLFIGIESPVAVVRAGGVLFVLTLGGTVWRIVG